MAVVWGTTQGGAIEGNSIRGGFAGITVSGGSPSDHRQHHRGCHRSRHRRREPGHAVVEGNTVCGCGTNLSVAEDAGSQVGENDICPDEATE